MRFIISKKRMVFCFLIFSNSLFAQQPLISSFSPVSGLPGATITIIGSDFTNVTNVSFGGIPAASFLVNSPTNITAIVGQGGTGAVKITTDSGIATLPGFALLRNICPGGSTVFTSNISGTNYQWQVNKGSGFINLADNSNYSGTKTITLNLTNIPSSWYGHQYRCYVDGSISMVVTLRFSVSWNGSTNTAWENPLNWSCGILPDSNTDIVINSGATNFPTINSNSSCRSMKVNNSTVTINSGKILNITGKAAEEDAVLNESVYIIDTMMMTLTSTPIMIEQGVYEYTSTDSLPNFMANDIIVGATGEGYIRRINSVDKEPGKITLHTSAGVMEDVFNKGDFDFAPGTNNLAKVNSTQTGNTYTFGDITLLQTGPITIKLKNGNINFDPNWHFDFNFKAAKLNFFELSCQNASLQGSFELEITASQAITLFDIIDTLQVYSKTFVITLPVFGVPVPVIVKMDLSFLCAYSASIDASITQIIVCSSTSTMDLGVKYENGAWQSSSNFNNTNTISVIPASGQVNAAVNLGIIPTISFKLYGSLGAYASVGLMRQFKAGVTSPSLDWDFLAGAWLQTTIGTNAVAFGDSLFNFRKQWYSDTTFYKTPDHIIKISGDNQNGQADVFLTQPIKVRVMDSRDSAQTFIPVKVYFNVTAGGGSVQQDTVWTDANGYAQTLWKLGNDSFNVQHLQVTAKRADGSLIGNAPVEFAALSTTLPLLTTSVITSITAFSAISGGNVTNESGSPVTSRGVCWSTSLNPTTADSKTSDGAGPGSFVSSITGLTPNTTYHLRAYATNSVGTSYGNPLAFITAPLDSTFTDPRDGQVYTFRHIGSQVWMTKNLNYVPATGSFCHGANSANCTTYGRLYNWSTALTVAPPGWHLPSDAEWTTLTTFLGGQSVAGGAMKDTVGWNPPNNGATNSSGFKARPGGLFIYGIGYASLGNIGYWWSSTEDDPDRAWYRVLSTNNTNAGRGSNLKVDGFSVRCIRDY